MRLALAIDTAVVQPVPAHLAVVFETADVPTEVGRVAVLAQFALAVVAHLVIDDVRLDLNLIEFRTHSNAVDH